MLPIGKQDAAKTSRYPPAAAEFPARPGTYGMIIRLDHAVTVTLTRRPSVELPPGLYFYGGSARGPGGIRARLARHLRRSKRKHWHVDQLTTKGEIVGLWASESATECRLVACVSQIAGTAVPVPGFGSSDCRACPAHLIAIPAKGGAADVLETLGKGLLG